MNVVILGPVAPLRGGIAAHTGGLESALRNSGARVEVIGYRRLYPKPLFPGSSQFAPRGTVASASVECPAGKRVLLDPLRRSAWRTVNSHLRRTRPEVIVVQWWHPAFAPAISAALVGLDASRVVFVCHNASPHESFPGAGALTAFALRRADAVLCHSDFVASCLALRHRSLPIGCVAMPVLLAAPSQAQGRTRIRGSYSVGSDGRLVVCPGLVRRYKGVDGLIEAWGGARVPGGTRLVIAGESYLRSGRLQRLIARYACGDTVCVDDRYFSDDEFVSLLAAADLVVLPHRYASQSGVVPMAAAAGVPVLCSDAGGLAEPPPFNAEIHSFSAGSLASLRSELERTVSPPVTRMSGADALRQPGAERRFSVLREESWTRVVEALDVLVRRLHMGPSPDPRTIGAVRRLLRRSPRN